MSTDFLSIAEATRDALAEIAVDSDTSGDYAAARDILNKSGLPALRVPVANGGPGATQHDVMEVCRILGSADPGLTQLLQPHYGFTDAIEMVGSAEARDRLYADVVAGHRIANAASERGGRHAADFSTKFVRQLNGSFLVSGTKYYATGSLGARWITVLGLDQDGQLVMAFLPVDAPGVRIVDDWNGMGQRGSSSGTLHLDDVTVPDDYLFAWTVDTRPKAWAEAGRLVHAAIDVGIAEGALRYGIDSVLATNRVPFELAKYNSLSEDPVLQYDIGRSAAQVKAVAALLRETAATLDLAQTDATNPESHLAELRAGLAATKALAADVSNTVSSDFFAWTGARTAGTNLRADRFWRNARTHTLHDPVRQRYSDLGQALLTSA